MRICITGSTGVLGHHVAEKLLKLKDQRHIEVRAAVHHLDQEETKKLEELGAEIVLFDYEDPESLKSAFKGVNHVFLLVPFGPKMVNEVKASIAAAIECGVTYVVRLSAAGADPDGPPAARPHGVCDAILKESGLGWSLLCPTFLQDSLYKYWRREIEEQGKFWGASGDGKTAYVAGEDIGDCAVEVLLHPRCGQQFLLKGPAAVTSQQIAEWVSDAIGRTVEYVDLEPAAFKKMLMDEGFPESQADIVTYLEGLKRDSVAAVLSDDIKKLLGRDPIAYEDFLRLHAGDFKETRKRSSTFRVH